MRPTQISNRKPRDPKQRILFLLLLLAAVWGGKYFLVKHMYLPRLVLTQPIPTLASSKRRMEDITVASVAISPDGRTIFSGGTFFEANTVLPICVWDAQTGKLRRTFGGHKIFVNALACSHDGKLLASNGWDNTVCLWNLETGKLLWKHIGAISSLVFSSDDRYLAIGGAVWRVSDGKLEHAYNSKAADFLGTAFSPDGKIFACVAGGSVKTLMSQPGQPFTMTVIGEQAQLWDVATGKLLRTLPYSRVQAMAFSPDGKSLTCLSTLGPAGISQGTELHSVNLETGNKNWEWSTGNNANTSFDMMNSLAYSPNGKWLLCETFNYDVLLFNAVSGKLVRRMHPLEWAKGGSSRSAPDGIGFSSDGKTLVGRGRHTVQVWDTSTLL